MGEVEFLIKLRDGSEKAMEGLALIHDATQEYLETMAPVDMRELGDFNMLKWIEKEGTKEPYQQTTKEANNNSKEFQALQQKLEDKGGFFQTKGYKFWNHRDNPDIIDRRAR